jgi:hypothetical protein
VYHTAFHQNCHGFSAFIAYNLANQGALEGWFSFRHVGSLLGGLLLSKNGFGTSDIAARGLQRGRIAQLLRSFLHAQGKVSLLQGFHFLFQGSLVFGAEFSSFISHVDSP